MNTLNLFQPFAFGGVPNWCVDVGGITSPERIETRPPVQPWFVQPVEFVTQMRASGSSANIAGGPPMSSVSTTAWDEASRTEIVVAKVFPTYTRLAAWSTKTVDGRCPTGTTV